MEDVKHIGKEANDYELVQTGLVEAEEEVLTIYPQDAWDLIPNVLSPIHAGTVAKVAGCGRRAACYYRSDRRKPKGKRLRMLTQLAARFARDELKASGETIIPQDDMQAIGQYLRFNPRGRRDVPKSGGNPHSVHRFRAV